MPAAVLLRSGGATYVLGVELALDDLALEFENGADNGPSVAVLDHEGEFIFGAK